MRLVCDNTAEGVKVSPFHPVDPTVDWLGEPRKGRTPEDAARDAATAYFAAKPERTQVGVEVVEDGTGQMAFVVRIYVAGQKPLHEVFRDQADARRFYDASARAALSGEELPTPSGDAVLVRAARLFQAEASDPREAVEQVARGEAELLDSTLGARSS